jgi:translation initiation factor 1
MGRRDDEDDAARPLSHNPFGALSALHDQLPAGEGTAGRKARRAPARAVVQLQRLPGGREVTAISELGLTPKGFENWLKALTTELGCRGTVAEDVLYLEGDQRARLPALLKKRRVSRVIVP